jgi:hypothetical protein
MTAETMAKGQPASGTKNPHLATSQPPSRIAGMIVGHEQRFRQHCREDERGGEEITYFTDRSPSPDLSCPT